jgi:para-nitrobenzyl esterase
VAATTAAPSSTIGAPPLCGRVDGAYLAAEGNVVVEVQYRLGVFGFLAHPAFATESATGATGNYGLMDQIAALAWVRGHIAAFGGDPTRVMAFGQSAGGRDVCLLIASPRAKGLFASAIVESGGCKAMLASVGATAALNWAAALNCSGDAAAGCLRSQHMETLLGTSISFVDGPSAFPNDGDVPPDTGFKYPVIDGDVIPDDPIVLLGSSNHPDVPVIMSNCHDEFANESLLKGLSGDNIMADNITSTADLTSLVEFRYGKSYGDIILPQYPVANFGTPQNAFINLATDSGYICDTRRALRALAGQQMSPVWWAVFDMPPMSSSSYVPHASELPFIFHTLDENGYPDNHTPADLTVANSMVGYWTRFAATGNPNGSGAPNWPAYTVASDTAFFFSSTPGPVAGFRMDKCAFWDQPPP